jgi:transposase-like protein
MKAIATVGERLRLIKDWQQSGLSISEWCRRNGIHPNTFCNWIHRSRKQGLLETPAVVPQPIVQDPVPQDIVKIEVVPRDRESVATTMIQAKKDPLEAIPSSNKVAVMEILIGNIRIKATNQINPQLLSETIRLLGGDALC